MSKRPPIRRVSTRKAPPPPVALQHRTDDDDSLYDSELEIPPLAAESSTEVPPNDEEPKTATATVAEDQPTAEDYDSLTEGAQLTDVQVPEPDPQHPTTIPDDIRTRIPTAVTSLVASSSSTPVPESSATARMHRLKKSKEDLYKEYMFGIDEQAEIDAIPTREAPVQAHGRFRLNRTYNMRMDCNARRINLSRMVAVEEAESPSMPGSESAKRTLGFIPPNLFREPKIKVRPTLGSKFRYLYNRRPQGVKVYFKHAKVDPKDRPPFVSATRI